MTRTVDEVIMILSKTFRKRFEDFKGMYLFGTFLDGKPHEGEEVVLGAGKIISIATGLNDVVLPTCAMKIINNLIVIKDDVK